MINTVTITVPATVEITLPHDAGTRTIDVASLPVASWTYLFAYGCQQQVDAASDARKFAAENQISLKDAVVALIDKRLARIAKGEMGMRGPRDPLGSAIIKVLSMPGKAYATAKGAATSETWTKLSKERRAELVDGVRGAQPGHPAYAFLEQARALLETPTVDEGAIDF